MNEDSVEQQQNLFRALPELKDIFAREGRKLILNNKETLFQEGAAANACYYIDAGEMLTYCTEVDGKNAPLAIYYPGSFFGLDDLCASSRHTYSATATQNSTLYALDQERFLKMLAYEGDVAHTLLQILGRDALYAKRRLASLLGHDVMGKLVHFLVLSSTSLVGGGAAPSGEEIPLRHSQNLIAEMIASTQSTVSLRLAALRGEGLVLTGRKRIIVPDPAALWESTFPRPFKDTWP